MRPGRTFKTDLGWDTMKIVAYLVILSPLMEVYLWFIYITARTFHTNLHWSFQLALDRGSFTNYIMQIYKYRNSLFREIKNMAAEYDAE